MVKQRTRSILNHAAPVLFAGFVMAWVLPSDTVAAAGENDARAVGPNSTPAFAPAVAQEQRAAVAAFSEQHPRTRFSRAGSQIRQIYGRSFGSGDSPEQVAEQFRLQHAGMFGVSAADLRPVSILEDQRHTQQVMFDRQTGEYKFTLVYYSQFIDRIPVFRADLRLLVRNESDSPLVLASANLRNLGGFAATLDDVDLQDAPLWEGAASEFEPELRNFTKPQAVIWAGVDDMVEAPALAVTFVGDNNGAPPADPIEKWLFVVDVTTAKILYQEDLILETDVFGHVGGMASDGPGADICADEIFKDMPHARVNIIGDPNVFADEFGDFVLPNAGNTQVTVQSPIRGQYFVVENFNLPNTELSMSVIPPGPADFTHNALNNSEFNRAEVNGYIEANFVRDFIVEANPTYPVIGSQTGFTVSVNRSGGICPGNAQYTGNAINFCRAGNGFPNTAWTSVVYHEYGHHLVATGGSGQGAYGEGMGDVLSAVGLDDSRLGFGFFGDCGSSLRNADNDLQYPCSGPIHTCGQLLSGSVWSTRNELIVTEPVEYLDILRSLSVNAVLLHGSSSNITPQITIDWLTLDDDDDNIGNGTPHYNEINAGFGAHNMPAPPLELISFIYPDGRPDLLSPNTSTVIAVNVEPISGAPVPGTGTLSYRIGTAGPFTTVAMAETSPNEYEATLPGADCLELMQYFFTADSEEMGGLTDPPNAPATTFEAVAATSLLTFFEDDFEANQGWSVANGGGLGDGAWNRGIPVDCNRGDPPNDADGSGQCYLTDNSSGNFCNSDVDDGSTTLTSPVMDALQDGTTISYDRWYSNTAGDSPMQDIFVVQVSDDGGASWVSLETVGPSGSEVNGGWFHKEFFLAGVSGLELTDQFRIRFTASDTDPQSIVEAGVDHVRLFAFECKDPCPADLTGDGIVSAEDLGLLLGAWGPNPGDPADLDGDDQVGAADLGILLGDWGKCP